MCYQYLFNEEEKSDWIGVRVRMRVHGCFKKRGVAGSLSRPTDFDPGARRKLDGDGGGGGGERGEEEGSEWWEWWEW